MVALRAPLLCGATRKAAIALDYRRCFWAGSFPAESWPRVTPSIFLLDFAIRSGTTGAKKQCSRRLPQQMFARHHRRGLVRFV